MVLLEVKDLTVEYLRGSSVTRAVDNVEFSVDRGDTLALVGESGSGKSTIARAILRLLPDESAISGSVTYDGTEISTLPMRQFRSYRGDAIGTVFQNPAAALNPSMTIGRQLTEVLRIRRGMSKRDARDRVLELLELVGISDPARRLHAYPHELSGGMRQRAVIAIAISCEPQLLLADEPTTALDVTIEAQIVDLVMDLRDRLGMSLIWITHDLGLVARLCDRVAVMSGGRIVEQGDVYQVFESPRAEYTQFLLDAIPGRDRRRSQMTPKDEG